MQSVEFAQLSVGLALIQYFLTMLPFPHFEMGIYILCHFMVEVNLLFDFHFIGVTVKGVPGVSEQTGL